MRTIVFAIGIALACASTAFAQGPTKQPSPNSNSAAPPGNQAQNNQPIRQQVQNNLSRAGYTDIKIMPESFLVRAKDRSGNPVMMIINPELGDCNHRGQSGRLRTYHHRKHPAFRYRERRPEWIDVASADQPHQVMAQVWN